MGAYGLFFLVAVAIGGVAWVFLYPYLSGEKKAERRVASVARAEPMAARPTRGAQRSRREQVEGTLKEIEQRRKKAKRPPLAVRLTQAGLSWSNRRFVITAVVLGVAGFVVMMVLRTGLLPALGVGFAASCGLPFWALSYLKKRREVEISRFIPGCGRRHCSRHQGRPAFAGQPQIDRRRRGRAGAQRISRRHRDPDDRHADRRCGV